MIAAVLAGIVYGSLYPFDFRPNARPGDPIHTLLATWRLISNRGDVMANVVFYLPAGFFLWLAMRRGPVSTPSAFISR